MPDMVRKAFLAMTRDTTAAYSFLGSWLEVFCTGGRTLGHSNSISALCKSTMVKRSLEPRASRHMLPPGLAYAKFGLGLDVPSSYAYQVLVSNELSSKGREFVRLRNKTCRL